MTKAVELLAHLFSAISQKTFMTPTDENPWRRLRQGDRVKMAHFPHEFSDREYTIHAETRVAYRHLIETHEVLCVGYIDDDGYPWVEFTTDADNGVTEHHSLLLNHDGIVLVDAK